MNPTEKVTTKTVTRIGPDGKPYTETIKTTVTQHEVVIGDNDSTLKSLSKEGTVQKEEYHDENEGEVTEFGKKVYTKTVRKRIMIPGEKETVTETRTIKNVINDSEENEEEIKEKTEKITEQITQQENEEEENLENTQKGKFVTQQIIKKTQILPKQTSAENIKTQTVTVTRQAPTSITKVNCTNQGNYNYKESKDISEHTQYYHNVYKNRKGATPNLKNPSNISNTKSVSSAQKVTKKTYRNYKQGGPDAVSQNVYERITHECSSHCPTCGQMWTGQKKTFENIIPIPYRNTKRSIKGSSSMTFERTDEDKFNMTGKNFGKRTNLETFEDGGYQVKTKKVDLPEKRFGRTNYSYYESGVGTKSEITGKPLRRVTKITTTTEGSGYQNQTGLDGLTNFHFYDNNTNNTNSSINSNKKSYKAIVSKKSPDKNYFEKTTTTTTTVIGAPANMASKSTRYQNFMSNYTGGVSKVGQDKGLTKNYSFHATSNLLKEQRSSAGKYKNLMDPNNTLPGNYKNTAIFTSSDINNKKTIFNKYNESATGGKGYKSIYKHHKHQDYTTEDERRNYENQWGRSNYSYYESGSCLKKKPKLEGYEENTVKTVTKDMSSVNKPLRQNKSSQRYTNIGNEDVTVIKKGGRTRQYITRYTNYGKTQVNKTTTTTTTNVGKTDAVNKYSNVNDLNKGKDNERKMNFQYKETVVTDPNRNSSAYKSKVMVTRHNIRFDNPEKNQRYDAYESYEEDSKKPSDNMVGSGIKNSEVIVQVGAQNRNLPESNDGENKGYFAAYKQSKYYKETESTDNIPITYKTQQILETKFIPSQTTNKETKNVVESGSRYGKVTTTRVTSTTTNVASSNDASKVPKFRTFREVAEALKKEKGIGQKPQQENNYTSQVITKNITYTTKPTVESVTTKNISISQPSETVTKTITYTKEPEQVTTEKISYLPGESYTSKITTSKVSTVKEENSVISSGLPGGKQTITTTKITTTSGTQPSQSYGNFVSGLAKSTFEVLNQNKVQNEVDLEGSTASVKESRFGRYGRYGRAGKEITTTTTVTRHEADGQKTVTKTTSTTGDIKVLGSSGKKDGDKEIDKEIDVQI